jgi:hypothetical protein
MYFVVGVDLKDVCTSYWREKNLYNSLDKISLSNAVKLTLGIELDKEYQLYPWINRPIYNNIFYFVVGKYDLRHHRLEGFVDVMELSEIEF